MNFRDFFRKVTAMKEEAERLAELLTNPQQITSLKSFSISISKLYDFLQDTKNMDVLCEVDKKQDSTHPLDILSKDIIRHLNSIDNMLIFSHLNDFRPESQSYSNENFVFLTDSLENLLGGNLFRAFEILKYMNGHNKTLIILGANGSGKTSFANYLRNIESHVKVIPASKPIKALGNVASLYNSTVDTFSSTLFQGGDLREELLHRLIIGLCTEHTSAALKYFDGEGKDTTTFIKVKKTFDDFFDVKLNSSDFGSKQMQASKAGPPYPFNNMSDGERVAFFYIATVIVAPPNSFIIVDEPENHLNPAIYNKIWDRLIEERGDCQFIFISHTMEFINARTDFELVKIKRFTYPDNFEFEFLGSSLQDLSPDFIVEIVGSRKPLLFCEGSKIDYDYKIYENLFGGQYTVIPTGNCISVENSVDACNKHANKYSIQSAFGIIDSDLKSEAEIERLRAKRVYTLKCNEIEMLLLDEAIFKRVLEHIFGNQDKFDSFKTAFFVKLTERKEHIVKRLVKTQIDEKLQSSVIDDKSHKTQIELKDNLAGIFMGIDVDELWTVGDAKLTDIITRQDYDAALKYCCLEHTEVIPGVVNRFVTDYATFALGVLKKDATLAAAIKAKYFPYL